jgi:hypothetical protein
MNQLSSIGFGTDATVLHGYAQTANERLGAVDFQIENTGNIPLVFQLRQYDGTTSPSGYANVGASVTVAARGAKTVGYNLLNKRVGFFGSGVPATVTVSGVSQYVTSTTANITAVLRNKGDLRGAQIDLVATGRKGWSYDEGFARTELKKKWGTMNTGNGNIDPTAEGV